MASLKWYQSRSYYIFMHNNNNNNIMTQAQNCELCNWIWSNIFYRHFCWLWVSPHSELCWAWILVMYISPAFKKNNLVPKRVQFLNLVSLDDVHVCAQNGRMFGRRLSFSSLVHFPRCFICSFGCCLEKLRPPLACCISGFFPFWSYEILCGFFFPLLFLIPGCLHTSLGLRLACWTISKPRRWTRCRHTVVCELLCNGLP